MKKLLFVLMLAVSHVSIAQLSKDDVDIIQSLYGKSKKDLVSKYMTLPTEQQAAFWTMYDAYEAERKVLGQERFKLINQYAKEYVTLDDATTDVLAKAVIKNNIAYEKLLDKYYGKCKKITGALNAAKFVQLEAYLQTTVKSELQDDIPFIGEIDRTIPHQH
ncbi:MAG: hypothetical protein JNK61_04185 [Bacteroidia bacterium]|nr:hypothetical protein [Bacteroidia bacterium]